jgi:hypothetical protein
MLDVSTRAALLQAIADEQAPRQSVDPRLRVGEVLAERWCDSIIDIRSARRGFGASHPPCDPGPRSR